MKKRQIVNIVNFLRGVEPREERDLITPFLEQVRLMKENRLKGTFLLQYDTLLDPRYVDILRTLDPAQFELGVWHEIVQPQAEACGIPWHGRWSWDWHCHCGFPVGYTNSQREQLADALFQKFFSVFGYYPRVFGSWFFDSHTARYVCDKYNIDAMCNCKEQCGTDGYTLWGGFYGQGYYPSRSNVFFPAQKAENALSAPVFRMLGSDPVYQYDCGLNVESTAPKYQGVITLEPSYTPGGRQKEWVDWFMRENFGGDCLSFGYAQAGQENSFGWDLMRDGICYQFPLFAQLQKEGKIEVETLGETGRWFKRTYKETPPSAITAHTAFDDAFKNSVWYSSRFYRVNLFCDNGDLRIRDLHVFKDTVADPFEHTLCTENSATYETLPVIDGFRHSGNGIVAGARLFYEDGTPLVAAAMSFCEESDRAVVTYGDITFNLYENGITIAADRPFTLAYRYGNTTDHFPNVFCTSEKELRLSYKNEEYLLTLQQGHFTAPHTITSEANKIAVRFD